MKLASALLLPAVVATTAPTAHAQTDAGEASLSEVGGGVEDIVVTARRRSENIQNVPLSVTGISADTMSRQNITSVERLDGLAPSLSIRTAPGPTTSGIVVNIRGIGGSDATGISDYPIATYVDGVLIARPNATLFDLVDLERVEILRGPQGTLFGRNTTGGAINIATKAPAHRFGVEQRLIYGTYNLLRARTTIDTGELGNSGVAIKTAYSHISQDGYIPNTIKTNSGEVGAKRSNAAYIAVHGEISQAFTIDLRADYMKSRNVPLLQQLAYMSPLQFAYFSQSPSFGGDPLVITTKKPKRTAIADQPRGRNENWGGSGTFNYEFSPAFSLKSITGYRKFEEEQPVSNGAQGRLLGRLADGTIGRVYLFDYPTSANAKDRTFTQEVQALGSLGNLDYVLGLYYFDERYSSRTTQNFTFAISPTSALTFENVRDYIQRSKSYAAFGQISYKPSFAPELELTGGLRYTHDKKSIRQANFSNGAALTPGVDEDSWSDFSWSASANYRLSPQFMLYTRAATAYRAGGFDAGGAGNPNGFDPEKVKSYEAGFKADLIDRTLRINGSAYFMNYNDLQVSQFVAGTSGGRTQTVNAGKASFSGFELEVTAAPTDDFAVNWNVGYVHSNYKQYKYLDPATNLIIDVADEVHNPHVPDWTGNVGADWVAAKWNDTRLRVNVNYAYQAGSWNFPLTRASPYNPLIRQNAQENLSARITLEDIPVGSRARLTVQAYGENLLDQDQRINSADFGSLGFATLTWAEGRRFGIMATARY
ncbi:TonB-dependent receptor [Sphingobium vermicomposti]|uniref:Iron complex outermembrane receptor protein n=1 Tax=Sphingobium vermicomposti TaxID=529005 RepID=A0A846M9L5_9SPHN|nr:TonB-dependent receptor [Sphingobium vermicomposti]NIJ17938.1 iron complex outermembrane receptor protein [Sphingobium vermicomposti]